MFPPATSPPATVTMVEMEERLRNDPDGSCRDEILEKLSAHGAALAEHIAAGLPPDEFTVTNQLHGAIELARTVVEKFWSLQQIGRR